MKTKKNEFIRFRLPEDLKKSLRKLSEKQDRPFSQIIREAIKNHLKMAL
jgi:predicted DNA-binding protein